MAGIIENIKDVPYGPTYRDAEVNDLLQLMEDSRDDFSDTANYFIMSERGYIYDFIEEPCHGQIASFYEEFGESPHLVASELGWERRGHHAREIVEPFFHWWTTESYMARFIVKADLDKGVVVVSADAPLIIMQNVLIASRHFYEVRSEAFEKWNELAKMGLDKHLLFNLIFSTSYSGDDVCVEDPVYSRTGHRTSPLLSLEGLKNIVQGTLTQAPDIQTKLRITFRQSEDGDFFGGSRLFEGRSGQRGLLTDDLFKKGYKSKEGTTKTIPNPFAPLPSTTAFITYGEYFEKVIPWIAAYIEKEIKNDDRQQ